MTAVINESKALTKKKYLVTVNVNLMLENLSQIKSGITINVDVNARIWENIMYARKVIFGVLVHVFVKLVNI